MHSSTRLSNPAVKRMKSWLLPACLALAMWTAVASVPAYAADASNREQAIGIAVQQNGGNGKVLGVQTQTDASGQTVYAVKILSNGRVRVFQIRQRK